MTEGDRVELNCTASGIPLPEIEWFVNEGEVPITTDGTTTLINTVPEGMSGITSTLSLLDIQFAGSGTYVCMAINSLGNDTALAVLTVYGEPS